MTEVSPDGRITREARGHVFLVGIDRTDKANAFTPKMFSELVEAYTELDENDEYWVGVLFGHGRHFTAGLDLPRFAESMRKGERAFLEGGVDPYGIKRRCRKPIVCAVQGVTYTAGLEFLLACDIAIAAEGSRFSQLEPTRGLMASGGATFRFVQRAGWGNAMAHLLTGDQFDAQQALRIGLVQEVVAAGQQFERAFEVAESIAKAAPLAVQATKASANTFVTQGEPAAIAELIDTQTRLSNTQDAAEGMASFQERREPKYTGR